MGVKALALLLPWSASVFGAQVNLAWDAVADSRITGYMVSYGTANGVYSTAVDAGNVTSYTVTGLADNTTYYFVVTAHSANSADTSGYSNQVNATTADILVAPTSKFATSPTSGTVPLAVQFTNQSVGTINTYQWDFGDFTGSIAQNPQHTFTAVGSYPTTLMVSGSAGSNTSAPTTITVAAAGAPNESLFTSQSPALLHNRDGVDYEVGTRFKSTVAGTITALRFWKDSSETGAHTGRLWSAGGSLLASAVFTGETPSGWQTQKLVTPYSIAANTEYLVSANTTNQYYVATLNGLTTAVSNGHLATIAVGTNGRYGAVGQYPTQSYQQSNYFRDVVFVAGPAPSDITPPTINVDSMTINASATDNVGVASMTLSIDGLIVKTVTTSTLSYLWGAATGQHTIAVNAQDAAGNNAVKTITVTR